MLRSDMGKTIITLLVLSVLLSSLFSSLSLHYQLDPLELDNKVQKISNYSISLPPDERQTLELIKIYTSKAYFCQQFSNESLFQKLLLNETVYNNAFNQEPNFITVFSIQQLFDTNISRWIIKNPSSIKGNSSDFTEENLKIALEKCDELNNLTKHSQDDSADGSDENRDDTADGSIKKEINSNETLEKIKNNYTIKALFYLSLATQNQSIKRQILQEIHSRSKDDFFASIEKDQIIKIISENNTLQNVILASIYDNESMRNVAISVMMQEPKSPIKLESYYFYSAAFIWHYWKGLIFLWIILVSLLWLRKVGKGIVVVDFADETKENAEKPTTAQGISSLLVVKLNRLNRLYHQVDEARQVSSMAMMEQKLGSAIKVEEGDLSTNIFTEDSSLTMGPLSIPGNVINSLIDRLAGRPKIYGSLHKEGDREILTARISTRGRTLSWIVDGQEQLLPAASDLSDPKHKPAKRTRDDMVVELACRIFTDLTFDEAKMVPWKATWHFTQGLRKYRENLRAKNNNKPMLEDAARSFHRALQEDDDYPWAHYNLAVVYIEIANLENISSDKKKEYLDSARQTLCSSIERYPKNWQSYYALALVSYEIGHIDDNIREYCDEATKLCFDYVGLALSYNLKGRITKEEDKKRLASYYALLSLIKAEFQGEDTEIEKYIFCRSLREYYLEIPSIFKEICIHSTCNKTQDKNTRKAPSEEGDELLIQKLLEEANDLVKKGDLDIARSRLDMCIAIQHKKTQEESLIQKLLEESKDLIKKEDLIGARSRLDECIAIQRKKNQEESSSLRLIKEAKQLIENNDFIRARSKLETAGLLDEYPQGNWEIPWLMARSYLLELPHATNDLREDLLKRAHQQMIRALSSCRDADMNVDGREENEIKCLGGMGWICILQKKYSEAISHLLVAKSLAKKRDDVKFKSFVPCIGFLLGLAYLRSKMYHQSEQEFRDFLAFEDLKAIDSYLVNTNPLINGYASDRDKLYNLCKQGSCLTDICVDPGGFKVSSTGLLYTLTNLYLVTMLIERDVNFAKAEDILSKLDIIMKNFIKEDKNRRIAQSHLEHCWGWLYLRRSILEASPQNAQKKREFTFDKLDLKETKLDRVSIVGGEISSEISWKDKVVWLENATISNSTLNGFKVNEIYIAEAIIKHATIKKARVEDIEYYLIEDGNNNPELYTHFLGFSAKELSHLALNPKRVVLEDVEFESATVNSIKIKAFTVDLAIEHLQKSLDDYANPHAYLHLAQAYELQMEREKDEAKKAHLRQKALNACQHAIELDRFREHAEHTEDLKKRLGESPAAIVPPPVKEEKEGKAGVKETGTSGSSGDAGKKNQ
ncbi:tetratricopeptide repeat protein [Candidatus Methanocrinis natronophilus]|uniref:Tetratricopeptide repeat protein n=1 Tax=Candidatus Methanocrinis natronophilus TaxID=3033396 RepID=A0ABT5X768_9EURY|nr:hypothetical protein [Candidatus Methanocrinis natronophilus]MDF0590536.1 hypothetical protein [Candidatus Methanocrinis natronophilus]